MMLSCNTLAMVLASSRQKVMISKREEQLNRVDVNKKNGLDRS